PKSDLFNKAVDFLSGVLIAATECDDCCLSCNVEIKAIIIGNYCFICVSFFHFSQRSENSWFRIFFSPHTTPPPVSTTCGA
ncbi:hypothetical protein, partial [Escherichia coli]|uniref:hypothetical protein n=1 Tax=Escherichia coli TaxID=562 RepID=UPI001BAEF249